MPIGLPQVLDYRVITLEIKIERLIQEGVDEGAIALVDGRNPNVPGYEQGFFVRPTILQNVNPLGNIAKT